MIAKYPYHRESVYEFIQRKFIEGRFLFSRKSMLNLIYVTKSVKFLWTIRNNWEMENWWKNPWIFHMMELTIGRQSDGKKTPILREKYEPQFLRFYSIGFVWFYRAMGNWWGNTCISHMVKYTTGWESNRKKYILLEK